MAVSAQELLDEAERLKRLYPSADYVSMAAAVMEERERAARVVLGQREFGGGEGGVTVNPYVDVSRVAAAIRRTPVREGV